MSKDGQYVKLQFSDGDTSIFWFPGEVYIASVPAFHHVAIIDGQLRAAIDAPKSDIAIGQESGVIPTLRIVYRKRC